MVLVPAMNGLNCPFGVIRVVEWYYPEEYKTTGKEDYAVLELDQDIGIQSS
jgi:hypothetical protein